MKNEYTKKQIAEAIEYWKGKLAEKDAAEPAPEVTEQEEIDEAGDFLSKYVTVVENDGLVKLGKIINNLKTVKEDWVILGCIVGKDKYPVTGFTMSAAKQRAFRLLKKSPLIIECDPQNQLTSTNTKKLKDLLDAIDDQLGEGVKATKALSGIALKVGSVSADPTTSTSAAAPSTDDGGRDERAVTRLIDMNKLIDVTYNGKGCIFFKFDESKDQKKADKEGAAKGAGTVGRGHF